MGRRLQVEADGGSRGNPGPAGYGAVVRDRDSGEVLAEVADAIGTATNNVAEYRGLIAGLGAAIAFAAAEDVEAVQVRLDSKLVVEQMTGRWKVKHPDMQRLKAEADALVAQLPQVRWAHHARELNSHADRLANEAMDAAARGERWQRRSGPVVAVDEPAAAPAANRLSGWMSSPSPPTTTVLVRHGQTALTVDRRFSGIGEQELTDYGERQARAVAERLATLAKVTPVAAIWSSPLRRARATADVIADSLGLAVAAHSGLREVDFGEWETYTFGEVQERWPAEVAAWLASVDVAPPGGESFAKVEKRVRAALVEIVAAHPEQTVVVVSHVTPIKTLLRDALQAPATALYRLHLDPASLSVIDWYDDGPAVVRLVNDTSHVDALA